MSRVLRKRIVSLSIVALFLALAVSGCNWIKTLSLGLGEPTQILYKQPLLTLAWDPPVTDFPGSPTEIATYQVFYQEHGSNYWILLDEVPADRHPQCTIAHDRLKDGLYDFAIRAITVSGQVSPLHTSLDSSADPISGWYVFWVKSH
jgi:hypothetical protein